jgi:hypothetical protein
VVVRADAGGAVADRRRPGARGGEEGGEIADVGIGVTMCGVLMKPMVSPSGRARANSVKPISPPAPGRLRTTTDWPRSFSMKRAMVRAAASVPPPAAKATIMVSDLSGRHSDWAMAGAARRLGTDSSVRRAIMMGSSDEEDIAVS